MKNLAWHNLGPLGSAACHKQELFVAQELINKVQITVLRNLGPNKLSVIMKYTDFNLQETLGMTEPLKEGRVTYHFGDNKVSFSIPSLI